MILSNEPGACLQFHDVTKGLKEKVNVAVNLNSCLSFDGCCAVMDLFLHLTKAMWLFSKPNEKMS